MSLVASWRTALRIARREARRSKGRSALVVAMIALPVLAWRSPPSSYDMFTLHRRRTGRPDHGRGRRPVSVAGFTDADRSRTRTARSLAARQPGVRTSPTPGRRADRHRSGPPRQAARRIHGRCRLRGGTVEVRTADGVGRPERDRGRRARPAHRGLSSTVLDGRAPRTADRGGADRAGRRTGSASGIGGTVTNADGTPDVHSGRCGRVPVAAAARWCSSRRCRGPTAEGCDQRAVAGRHPGAGDLGRRPRAQRSRHRRRLPRRLRRPAAGRRGARNRRPRGTTAGPARSACIVGGLALLEIVLLAGPAFAVSARRRQRQLALVAANGGTPAHVRRIVLADGVVLGAGRRGRRHRRSGIAGAFAGPPVHRGVRSPTPGPAATGSSRSRWSAIAALARAHRRAGRARTGLHHRPAERRRVAGRAARGRRGRSKRWIVRRPGHGRRRRRRRHRRHDVRVGRGHAGRPGARRTRPGALHAGAGRPRSPGSAGSCRWRRGSRCGTRPATGRPPRRRSPR